MKFKNYLRNHLFWLVILLTIMTKFLEYIGQYTITKQILVTSPMHFITQLTFISTLSLIFYIGFNFIIIF